MPNVVPKPGASTTRGWRLYPKPQCQKPFGGAQTEVPWFLMTFFLCEVRSCGTATRPAAVLALIVSNVQIGARHFNDWIGATSCFDFVLVPASLVLKHQPHASRKAVQCS